MPCVPRRRLPASKHRATDITTFSEGGRLASAHTIDHGIWKPIKTSKSGISQKIGLAWNGPLTVPIRLERESTKMPCVAGRRNAKEPRTDITNIARAGVRGLRQQSMGGRSSAVSRLRECGTYPPLLG